MPKVGSHEARLISTGAACALISGKHWLMSGSSRMARTAPSKARRLSQPARAGTSMAMAISQVEERIYQIMRRNLLLEGLAVGINQALQLI
jgi:hypothetical protein